MKYSLNILTYWYLFIQNITFMASMKFILTVDMIPVDLS